MFCVNWNTMSEQLINRFYKNPGSLFLVDGVGAMLSSFLLGIVLVKFENVFGIPASTLYLLASFPVVFAVYDFYNYRRKSGKPGRSLRGIAIMNLFYCLLSVGATSFHHRVVTGWGWAYIIAEVAIVIALAVLELRVAKAVR